MRRLISGSPRFPRYRYAHWPAFPVQNSRDKDNRPTALFLKEALSNVETNVLLLDEPTNHLDVDAKEELKRALKEYKGAILLVCHEPEFYQDAFPERGFISPRTLFRNVVLPIPFVPTTAIFSPRSIRRLSGSDSGLSFS